MFWNLHSPIFSICSLLKTVVSFLPSPILASSMCQLSSSTLYPEYVVLSILWVFSEYSEYFFTILIIFWVTMDYAEFLCYPCYQWSTFPWWLKSATSWLGSCWSAGGFPPKRSDHSDWLGNFACLSKLPSWCIFSPVIDQPCGVKVLSRLNKDEQFT